MKFVNNQKPTIERTALEGRVDTVENVSSSMS